MWLFVALSLFIPSRLCCLYGFPLLSSGLCISVRARPNNLALCRHGKERNREYHILPNVLDVFCWLFTTAPHFHPRKYNEFKPTKTYDFTFFPSTKSGFLPPYDCGCRNSARRETDATTFWKMRGRLGHCFLFSSSGSAAFFCGFLCFTRLGHGLLCIGVVSCAQKTKENHRKPRPS